MKEDKILLLHMVSDVHRIHETMSNEACTYTAVWEYTWRPKKCTVQQTQVKNIV